MSKLIGLVGYAGAGKDTVASHLVSAHDFTQFSFAFKLKEIISGIFDVPMNHFEDRHLKNEVHPNLCRATIEEKFPGSPSFAEYLVPVLMELYAKSRDEILDLGYATVAAGFIREFLSGGDCTPRRAAQLIGTEGFRNHISQTTWTDYVMRAACNEMAAGYPVVISDTRFPDEFAAIHRIGGRLWGIRRSECESHSHSSESHIGALLDHCGTVLNNNGTIETLLRSVDLMMYASGGLYGRMPAKMLCRASDVSSNAMQCVAL